MTSDRIDEIIKETAYPESHSVLQALHQVWNEVQQENNTKQRLNELAEIEVEVVDRGPAHWNLRYWYGGLSYRIELPRTSQNKHLSVGDKTMMALGIEKPKKAPKMSVAEVYQELFIQEYTKAMKLGLTDDTARRKAARYAVMNSTKVWKEQYE